jgi:NADP-dependent 3-hydroxy acid dehydrogenase YdfG
MKNQLCNKIVIVTGASSGIGEVLAIVGCIEPFVVTFMFFVVFGFISL